MCGVCAICRFQVVEVMVTCVRAKRYDGSSRKIPYPTFADYLRTYLCREEKGRVIVRQVVNTRNWPVETPLVMGVTVPTDHSLCVPRSWGPHRAGWRIIEVALSFRAPFCDSVAIPPPPSSSDNCVVTLPTGSAARLICRSV